MHGLTKCCYFRCDRLSNMAARGHKSLWLAEIFNDLLLRYYMEDGIENCHEWSLQAANQVLLLFGLIENPRWLPAGDIINIATLWEIWKTNFFSRTTGWIGTILGRNVPDKVLINCCYFLFRSVIQYGCQGP
jgi:hypothetical protein